MSKSGTRLPTPPRSAPQPDIRRGGPARAVADLLPDIGGAAFRRFGFVQQSIVSRWAEIVGPRFAEVSSPESIRFPRGKREEGTLTLVVRGAHGPMMQHVAPELIERINRFFGYPAIAKLAFRQGALAAPAPTRAAPPSLKPVSAEIGDSLRAIADPEFRAVLEALAAGVATSRGAPVVASAAESDPA
ncbi:DUF721 domain-containing protein [Sphingomonas sp. GlSt437]|uniref:DUF721 domain-containing protein n=1 Tax=Sphingomonas sp. GlSt437 TaxID=3389970 RepID=UPI003A8BBF9B